MAYGVLITLCFLRSNLKILLQNNLNAPEFSVSIIGTTKKDHDNQKVC